MRISIACTWAGFLVLAGFGCTVAQDAAPTPDREPLIGGPCEGCEAVFEGLPSGLSAVARIAPLDEAGAPLRIEGTVYGPEGRPAPGVIVYAYHADATGVYPPEERFAGRAAYRHGRLRGWARTDENGRYRFDTIRPASYPSRTDPAHVHMHVIEVGRFTYYIDSIHFDDDPLLGPDERDTANARGGSGLTHPQRDMDGAWIVQRDIRLGLGVPGYPASSPSRIRAGVKAPLFAAIHGMNRDGANVHSVCCPDRRSPGPR